MNLVSNIWLELEFEEFDLFGIRHRKRYETNTMNTNLKFGLLNSPPTNCIKRNIDG